jgi:hypothetical protein
MLSIDTAKLELFQRIEEAREFFPNQIIGNPLPSFMDSYDMDFKEELL